MNGPYSGYSPLAKMNLNIMEPLAEVDGFEPQTRARSNTWPLPRPENFVDPPEDGAQCGAQCGGAAGGMALGGGGNKCPVPVPVSGLPTKKNSSRRNAWGNLSYADLITQAVTTSSDKRLTLAQIYEWMVQNVPYFKDKGDSNSSAGWKELDGLNIHIMAEPIFMTLGEFFNGAGYSCRTQYPGPDGGICSYSFKVH